MPQAAPPKPVDFTGVWSRTSSGLARVTLDYTPAAQRVVDAYHYLDDPSLRCVSPGLVRVSGWPYPLEIVQDDAQVTILYESFHEVRRIFLDGRDLAEKLPHRSMGYSFGRWEGSTLVVETKMLTPGYVDLGGQPLSENSRVVERMSLSADGQTLRSELTVYDPENYRRPITRHRAWRTTPRRRSSSTTAIRIRFSVGSRSKGSSRSIGTGCGEGRRDSWTGRQAMVSAASVVRTTMLLTLLAVLPARIIGQPSFDVMETTVAEIHRGYASGTLTARQLVQLYLDRIEAYDQKGPRINSIVTLNVAALEEADRLDTAYRTSGLVGPLHGIPVMLKDQIDAAGMPTTLRLRAVSRLLPRSRRVRDGEAQGSRRDHPREGNARRDGGRRYAWLAIRLYA